MKIEIDRQNHDDIKAVATIIKSIKYLIQRLEDRIDRLIKIKQEETDAKD